MPTLVLTIPDAKFPLGEVVITANAQAQLDAADVEHGLSRHASGDWGELDPHDTEQNHEALDHGGRLFSAYGAGEKRFWIVTECDRSVTTVLLPQDY